MINSPRRIGLSLIASKVSDLLLSPKTTLPALLNLAGAPVFLTSLLVPIRESGALLPQILFASLLSPYPHRHRAWRLGAFSQLLCSLLMLLAGFFLSGMLAGAVIVLCLALWSISRSLCSLTMKDIQGAHIEKGARGRLVGAASGISSFIAMFVAFTAWYIDSIGNKMGSDKLLAIATLALAAQCFCIFILWPLKTCVDAPDENKNEDKNGPALFNMIRKDKSLRDFIVMRSLLSHSALLAPLFTLAYSGGAISILSFLIISQALAGTLTSYIWGNLADRSALHCMRVGAAIATIAAASLIVVSLAYSELLDESWIIIILFFLLGVGHNGVRTGRKIYIVDIASGHERTQFVATSNTVVGIFILTAGLLYSILSFYSVNISLFVMFAALVLGLAYSVKVKKEK